MYPFPLFQWNALPKSLANGLQGYLLRILILCQGNNNGAAQTECVLVKVKGKRVRKLIIFCHEFKKSKKLMNINSVWEIIAKAVNDLYCQTDMYTSW